MRFIAEAASTAVDLKGDRFAPEALYQMAEAVQGKEIPILDGFNQHVKVGFVDSAKVLDNKLIIEGELLVGLLEKAEGFVVPGYQVMRGGLVDEVWVETDVRLNCFGLTSLPCDPTLKPLQEMEFKKCAMGVGRSGG